MGRGGRLVALVLLQALILGWVYRLNWADHFRMVMGDVYDNTIEVAILEHWYQVLRGAAHWAQTNYFYPYRNTLGYNDGYFLYGLLYAPCRALGADPFLAATMVHGAMKAAAFASFYWCGRRVFGLPFALAAVGAAAFELGNNVNVHTMHAQLLTVALAPLCAWLLYEVVQAWLQARPRRLLGYAVAFALVYGSWAMTSFYTLWFFSFYTLILLVIAGWTHRQRLLQSLRDAGRSDWQALAAGVFALVLCLLPFLRVYLPKARETGMHDIHSALDYAPEPFDLLNFGPGNFMYGQFLPRLHDWIGFPIDFSERQMGLTPGLVLLFIAASVYFWRTRRRTLVAATALAAIVLFLIAVNIDGISGWRLVYHAVPGAKALRVVSRMMIFLAAPVLMVVLVALADGSRRRAGAVACLLLAVFVASEQLNRVGYIAIDRAALVRRLATLAPPPARCQAFVTEDARPLPAPDGADALYRHNVDAMLISEVINLPTINGFSSFNPPDWQFERPQAPDYRARVHAYAARHALGQLCNLELATMQWKFDGYANLSGKIVNRKE